MGTDIHGFVERRTPAGWVATTSTELDLDRDYLLFILLAGTRPPREEVPSGVPKGLPPDPSAVVFGRTHSLIIETEADDDDDDDRYDEDGELIEPRDYLFRVTRAQAQLMIDRGRTTVWRGGQEYILDTFYHSHTWFTDAELASEDQYRRCHQLQRTYRLTRHFQITTSSSDLELVRRIIRESSADGSECRFICCFGC